MILFTAIATFIILKLVGLFVPLRMTDADMEQGDVAVHGHEVYPSDVPSLGFHGSATAPRSPRGRRLARRLRPPPDSIRRRRGARSAPRRRRVVGGPRARRRRGHSTAPSFPLRAV